MDNREKKRELIESAGYTFAQVLFRKKDGTLRRMLVQPARAESLLADNPSKERKAAAKKRAANNPHLYNVVDVDRGTFRSINLDTVLQISVRGATYTYVEGE